MPSDVSKSSGVSARTQFGRRVDDAEFSRDGITKIDRMEAGMSDKWALMDRSNQERTYRKDTPCLKLFVMRRPELGGKWGWSALDGVHKYAPHVDADKVGSDTSKGAMKAADEWLKTFKCPE